MFGQPSRDWLAGNIDDDTLIARISDNYLRLIALWRQRKAQ
ncbi:MAG: 2-deoxy-5-keto-D-gluconate 6-phosphate aldolase domain-containing protein [Plesiomonas shigelloides]